jgi:hypothetical protein
MNRPFWSTDSLVRANALQQLADKAVRAPYRLWFEERCRPWNRLLF